MSPDDYLMLSKQLDDGFVATHKRIDGLRDGFKECRGRQKTLFEKVGEVEKEQAVTKALESREERKEEKKWDLWKIIIRTSITCSVPLLIFILAWVMRISQNIKTP